MEIEIKVPTVGESISEVEIADWPKAEGDFAEQDEVVAVFETDKATIELPAPVAGRITRIVKHAGEKASVGDVVGYIEQAEKSSASEPLPSSEKTPTAQKVEHDEAVAGNGHGPVNLRDTATARPISAKDNVETPNSAEEAHAGAPEEGRQSREQNLVLVTRDRARGGTPEGEQQSKEQEQIPKEKLRKIPTGARAGEEQIVRMTALRRRIAERLVEAQKTAALLTTFNEIDVSALNALRQKYQEAFQKKHGVKLGVMSFFVKASIEALKLVPRLNAQVRGTDMVFHDFYDIGVAVGGEKGLVVPVLRNAERMSFSEIETAIDDFVRRARENKLGVNELEGGTFTITNGGIYGSLFSTPIVNPPQSGVLGMHAIQERPVARQGQVLVRPMMYVALTYDHRIVDGHEAVTFLKHVKDLIEEPARMLLEI